MGGIEAATVIAHMLPAELPIVPGGEILNSKRSEIRDQISEDQRRFPQSWVVDDRTSAAMESFGSIRLAPNVPGLSVPRGHCIVGKRSGCGVKSVAGAVRVVK
jgi:hypothetical protein